MRDLTLITATADQPTGLALLERYIPAQTVYGRVARWIVADDGVQPADPTLGQAHVRRERHPDTTPVRSLCDNLLAALPLVDTPFVAFIEDDDCYHPRHLEILLDHLERSGVLAAGDDAQRYYHVGLRQYHVYDNWRGASLYTMGVRREAIPIFIEAVECCHRCDARGLDAEFWRRLVKAEGERAAVTYRAGQAVGIKGLPGRAGIGIGHRPEEWRGTWSHDAEGGVLREWCREAAEGYMGFYQGEQEAGEQEATAPDTSKTRSPDTSKTRSPDTSKTRRQEATV